METELTNSGRGRLPAFTRQLRAMESEGLRYSYAKARNGSFKDRVPDHYRYGYLMNDYVRDQFGPNTWKGVLADGAAYKSLLYPFSSALKKRSGLSTTALYDQTLDAWQPGPDKFVSKSDYSGSSTTLTPEHREPTEYRFPHPQPDGSIIAYRSSFRRIPELVRITPDKKVEVLTKIGFQREPYLDVRGELAVWNEISQNPRYHNESYSDIVVYDISGGTKRKITSKGQFLSPSLSADSKRIVAATYHPLEGAKLAVMDSRENPVVAYYAPSTTDYYAWPVFAPDGETIYALDRRQSELAIISQSLTEEDRARIVLPFSTQLMDNLTIDDQGLLYFTAPAENRDNIYRLDPATGGFYIITDAYLGAYEPGFGSDGRLYYSTANAQGMEIAATQVVANAPVSLLAGPLNPLAAPLLASELPSDFPTQNFSDRLGGIHLHSWSYNGDYITPGLAIEATNALNTVAVAADVSYNYNEARTGGGLSFRYGGFFPVIELGGRYRERSVLVGNPDSLNTLAVNRTDFNQLELSAAVSLPLQWLSENFAINLQPGLSYASLQLSNRNLLDARLPDNFSSIGASLAFSLLERRAVRQVQPRWGLVLNILANKVAGGTQRGSNLLIRSSAYVPGFVRTHGIRLDLDVQQEELLSAYQYVDRMQYVRGFYAPLNDRAVRLGINYQLPLLYPDFGIAGITYFKRIRLNAFYDTGSFGLNVFDRNFDMSSAGGEIFFDNVWLNAQDITIGLQAAYRLTTDFFAPVGESDLRLRVLMEGSF
jgi:Tol biopolymer transport system component